DSAQDKVTRVQLGNRLAHECDLAAAEIEHHVAVVVVSLGEYPVARLTTRDAAQIQLVLIDVKAHDGLAVDEYVMTGAACQNNVTSTTIQNQRHATGGDSGCVDTVVSSASMNGQGVNGLAVIDEELSMHSSNGNTRSGGRQLDVVVAIGAICGND